MMTDPDTDTDTGTIEFAVNGTLMRGLELEPNMRAAGAAFVREARTAPRYRLWSIEDRHPAMIRVPDGEEGGVAVALEIWAVPGTGIVSILQKEPAGLCVGRVELADGGHVLGVLGEPWRVAGQREITRWGGWRAYTGAADTAEEG